MKTSKPIQGLILLGTVLLGVVTARTLQTMLFEEEGIPTKTLSEAPDPFEEMVDLDLINGEWQIGGKSLTGALAGDHDRNTIERLIETWSDSVLIANRTDGKGNIIAETIESKQSFPTLVERFHSAGWKILPHNNGRAWRMERGDVIRQIVDLGGEDASGYNYLIMRGAKPSQKEPQ